MWGKTPPPSPEVFEVVRVSCVPTLYCGFPVYGWTAEELTWIDASILNGGQPGLPHGRGKRRGLIIPRAKQCFFQFR